MVRVVTCVIDLPVYVKQAVSGNISTETFNLRRARRIREDGPPSDVIGHSRRLEDRKPPVFQIAYEPHREGGLVEWVVVNVSYGQTIFFVQWQSFLSAPTIADLKSTI